MGTPAARDVQRHLSSLFRAGWQLRRKRRSREMSDAVQNDRQSQMHPGRGPGLGDPGRFYHHQAAHRGRGEGVGGHRQEHLFRPGWRGQLWEIPETGDDPDNRGVFQLREVSSGAGGEIQTEPGKRAERGAQDQRRLPQHDRAHARRPEGDSGHLAGPEGQARAAVAHHPESRDPAEPSEERVHEGVEETAVCLLELTQANLI